MWFGIVKCKSDIFIIAELLILSLGKFNIVFDFVGIDSLKLQL